MFNPSSYENARLGGIPAMEIVSPDGQADQPVLFVPLRRSDLTGTVVGPLADLRLSQIFRFERSALDKTIEVIYRFPLPGDAAVTGVWVRFGATEIRTDLRERQAAEEAYEQAKVEGHQAALLTRESPDVFTLHVAGIRPDEDVTVETHLVQLPRPEGDVWTLRIPLTTAPRYVRSDERGGRHAHGQPLLSMRDPGHRFTLDLTMRGVEAIASPSHTLAVTPTATGLRVRLADGEVTPDRDLALRWRAAQDATRPTLQVWTQRPANEANVYFLALAAPPLTAPGDLKPREALLLVDHSGSMGRAKWEAAVWAATSFLRQLTAQDRFALCLFDSVQYWFADTLQAATPDAIEAAVAFVRAKRAMGGTELGVALEQALSLPRTEGEVARHVLVITDAAVSDDARILRLVDDEARRPDHRRVSIVCIDAAPNSYLAHEMAERGGGVARFLTSAPEEEDITTALDEILAEWAAPLAVDTRLEVNREAALSARGPARPGRAPGWASLDLGDLPTGRAVWLAGRAPLAAGDDLVVRLVADGRALTETRASLAPTGGVEALQALFAAPRLNRLEGLMASAYQVDELRAPLERLGYRADEALPLAGAAPRVYTENTVKDTLAALRGLLVRESLAAGLPTSETAFVAVRRDGDSTPVELTTVVGNALPTGWSPGFASLRVLSNAGGGSPRALFNQSADTSSLMNAAPDQMVALANQGGRGTSARAARVTPTATVFDGVPLFANGQATLVDTSAGDAGESLAAVRLLTGLVVAFPDSAPSAASIDRGLTLLVYVGDRGTPRARVRLADLVSAGGRRPLNVRRDPNEPVWIVVEDANGAWAGGAPRLMVTLECSQ